jgi:hypothetical protein
VGGANTVNQAGSYGTQDTAAPGDIPGARAGAVSWTDASGALWLFGGAGPTVGGGCNLYDPLCWAGTNAYFNDLWKYSGGEWTWVSGSNTTDQSGKYGTQGVAAAGNVPGARYGGTSWRDANGNFWFFGGAGYDSAGNDGYLNDLWKYSGGQWTWMGGSNVVNQMGLYGTQGTAAPNNIPGARSGAISVTDASGNLWLFGGIGCAGFCGAYLDDLWEYSGGQWRWVSGSNSGSQTGIYGTQGSAAPGNLPGGRVNASGWMDSSGNLWVFGGVGWGGWNGNVVELNDLWKFSGGEWTWVTGSNALTDEIGVVDVHGTYGVQGTAAPGNTPGLRDSAVSWTDVGGNLWLFGGEGFGASGAQGGDLNDLWKFNGSQWTWVSGSDAGGQAGTYGTLGTRGAGNVPGGRIDAVSWVGTDGNLWLFGGIGLGSTGTSGDLNDLWEYTP